MGHCELIARKTADVLRSIGYDCDPGDNDSTLVIRKWGARVSVLEGNAREEPGRVALFPAIVVFHRHLPGGWARELAVGMGATTADAVDAISASWMLLFFAPLKFLFDPHPHDCTVHEQPLDLPQFPGAAYRLLAGPLQMVGFGEAGQVKDVSQSVLWNAVADLLQPRLGRGVHHVRCYVGKFGGKVSADVFVDGEEWPDGSSRLRELAATFPEPDDAHPIYALKQHLFVRPEDLQAEAAAAQSEQVAGWQAAIGDQIEPTHRELAPHVLRGVHVFARAGWADEDERERTLIERGTRPDVAAALVAFLPSAAARLVLDGQVEFSPTYHWKNRRTGRAVERHYDQTPAFTAALHILRLLKQHGFADAVEAVASGSAEMNGARQALAQQGKLTGARFTAMIHHTDEDVDGEVLAPPTTPAPRDRPPDAPSRPIARAKPWWKFW